MMILSIVLRGWVAMLAVGAGARPVACSTSRDTAVTASRRQQEAVTDSTGRLAAKQMT